MRPASFGKRVFAYLIDSVIIGLITGIPGGCLGGIVSAMAPTQQGEDGMVMILVVLVFLVVLLSLIAAILYYALMWSRSGQTLGKKWLGIKVVTADGVPPSFWRALGRAVIGYPISSWLFSLGFLWMLWDDQRQCWHDKLFGTYVVEA